MYAMLRCGSIFHWDRASNGTETNLIIGNTYKMQRTRRESDELCDGMWSNGWRVNFNHFKMDLTIKGLNMFKNERNCKRT